MMQDTNVVAEHLASMVRTGTSRMVGAAAAELIQRRDVALDLAVAQRLTPNDLAGLRVLVNFYLSLDNTHEGKLVAAVKKRRPLWKLPADIIRGFVGTFS